jgi:vacuolar iron transporter family protein
MKLISSKKFKSHKNNYLFGSSSAIITNLGLIAGLYCTSNAKLNILGSILLIAIADNISDTLGIHIYQEAEGLKAKEVWFSSFTNFSSRLIISSLFALLIIFLPLQLALIYSIILGLLLLSIISYFIAVHKRNNPYIAIIEHLGIALLVIALSRILGNCIINNFH